MKIRIRIAALALLIVPLWATYQALTPAAPAPLSKFVPAGALLYLEAKDFSSLLADWSGSPEKTAWLQSDNYQVFSRSRLFLRLGDAQREFAAAAGLSPDMNFLTQVAGKQSAFAWYDIGKLEFLYITRNAKAAPDQSALWQSRSKFESRSVAGVPFYIRTDAESHRVVAFAVTGDYLILATREDLIAGALQLISGAPGRTVETEGWWSRSVTATGQPGDLRMVLNLEAIVSTPHFRSYWVQRNVTDMKQYTAAICDLHRSGSEYREERVLLRRSAPDAPRAAAGAQAAAELASLVPAGAGVFRAVADPTPDDALAALAAKLLAPRVGPQPAARTAPRHMTPGSGETGGGGDLETRIDQPPPGRAATGATTDALKRTFESAGVIAVLELQSTTPDAGGVFVRLHSLVALAAASDWRLPEVESAITAALQPSLTTGQLGMVWRQNKAGYAELDGLMPMVIAVRGKRLFVSDDPALLAATLANASRKMESQPAVYIAGFEHARERENFVRLASLVGRPAQVFRKPNAATEGEEPDASPDREPDFLSQNIGSLSRALGAVNSERITVRDNGDKVLHRVVYQWAR